MVVYSTFHYHICLKCYIANLGMSLGMAIMNQIGYQMTRQALTLMMRCITFFKLLGRLSYDQIDSTISSCAFTVLFNLYGGNLHWLSGSIRASLDQELLNSYIYLLNKIDVIRFIFQSTSLLWLWFFLIKMYIIITKFAMHFEMEGVIVKSLICWKRKYFLKWNS